MVLLSGTAVSCVAPGSPTVLAAVLTVSRKPSDTIGELTNLSQRFRSLVKRTFNPEAEPDYRGVIFGNKRPTPNSPTVSERL
jgi:hypothetical protein